MEGLLIFALAAAGLVFVLLRPQWTAPYFALLLYLRLSDTIRAEYGLPSLFMIIAPTLVLSALVPWLFKGQPAGRGWLPALALLLAYGGVCAGSLIFAAQTDRTADALLNYADGIVIVLIMTLHLRTRLDFRRTIWALIAAGGILGTLTVLQQLLGLYDQNFAGFSQVGLRNIFSKSSGYRSEGPVSANYFAMIMVVIVPLATERLLHDPRRMAKAIAAATLCAALVSIVFTYSRGGIVALAICSLPMLTWVPRRKLMPVLAAAAFALAVAGTFLVPADFMQRLAALSQVANVAGDTTPRDSALQGRLSEMTSAAMMFGDHPMAGVGYGNFEIHYPRYAQELALDGRREERQSHSLYLEVAAETGLLGLLAFGMLLSAALASVQQARTVFARQGLTQDAQLATAFGIALFGYLVASIFLHLTYPRYLWLLLGIALSLRPLAQSYGSEEAQAPHSRERCLA
jgi:O-antigen ligase